MSEESRADKWRLDRAADRLEKEQAEQAARETERVAAEAEAAAMQGAD
jgi:hypothetical protein